MYRWILPILVVLGLFIAVPARAENGTVPVPTPDDQISERIYRVRQGDTLWGMAVANQITVADLIAINELSDPSALAVGQRLVIPGTGATVEPVQRRYNVRAGDSLWSIAIAHRITVAELIAANRLNNPNRLSVGQTLNLPEGVAPPIASTAAPIVGAAPPVIQGPPPETENWPGYVLELINQKRAEHGLSPLIWSPTLAQAAQAHADDCASRAWCSHVSSDGDRLRGRLQRVGYKADWLSENWVYVRGPQRAVEWWYDEPPSGPHRLNILSDRAVEVGVGIATGQWGLYYIVADFARS